MEMQIKSIEKGIITMEQLYSSLRIGLPAIWNQFIGSHQVDYRTGQVKIGTIEVAKPGEFFDSSDGFSLEADQVGLTASGNQFLYGRTKNLIQVMNDHLDFDERKETTDDDGTVVSMKATKVDGKKLRVESRIKHAVLGVDKTDAVVLSQNALQRGLLSYQLSATHFVGIEVLPEAVMNLQIGWYNYQDTGLDVFWSSELNDQALNAISGFQLYSSLDVVRAYLDADDLPLFDLAGEMIRKIYLSSDIDKSQIAYFEVQGEDGEWYNLAEISAEEKSGFELMDKIVIRSRKKSSQDEDDSYLIFTLSHKPNIRGAHFTLNLNNVAYDQEFKMPEEIAQFADYIIESLE